MMLKALIESKRMNSKVATLSQSILALSCFGLLVSGVVTLSGCGGSSAQKEVKKEAPLTMSVLQLDQLSKLDDKNPDGQYLVARMALKNNTNATIVIQPGDFSLQNITKNEKEQYSQPFERGMTNAFGRVYGLELKDKVIDSDATNLYPRMQLERFIVFMVPSDSAVTGYQIAYKPANVTIPLVTPEVTVINDHRSETPTANDQPIQPNQP